MRRGRESVGGRRAIGWAALLCFAVGIALAAFWPADAAPTAPAGAAQIARITPEDAKDAGKRMEALTKDVTEGALRVVTPEGIIVECPLKHTDVKADVTGFIARVKVTQTFYNPLNEKIEAVYVFPLPHKSAVDDMTMVIGERRIVGIIKRRAEARSIYEQALAQGATAALLEQERPNIFTQSVGNIAPQQTINIEISYVDALEYDMGTYEFHYPMVVGPRYIPGGATSTVPPVPKELQGKVGELDKSRVAEGPDKPKGDGWAPDTDRVPDASRITPPVLKPGFRNGHDVSLFLKLDAGVPIRDLKVANHKADVKQAGPSVATAELSPADSIPNKDFVLRYAVVGEKPELAVLSHTDPRGLGTFMLMVQPKEDEKLKQQPARELVFLIDVSGSMSGAPTAKNVEAVTKFLQLCRPKDTVQVITFESDARKLFDKPVPVTPENIQKALGFASGLRGSGGTEMLKGIRMALEEPPDPERVRIVVMLTDGYIGNEAEIIAEVGKRCGDRIRFWCIGIGSSPNRFLTDGVAKQGGGMSKVLGLNDDATPVVEEAMARITRAQLAKVKIDWGGMRVFETYPAQIPELWAGRPIIVYGLYEGGGRATVRVSGVVEGQPAEWPVTVEFPTREPGHEVLAKVWARNKIEDLMQQTYYQGSPEVEDAVTQIALEYRLMSQYTSFVAVDETTLRNTTEPARPPRRMLVPVPIPEGTRYEGFFGDAGEAAQNAEGLAKLERESVRAPGVGYSMPMLELRDDAHGGGAGDRFAGKGAYGYARRYAAKPKSPAGKFMTWAGTSASVAAGPVDALRTVAEYSRDSRSRGDDGYAGPRYAAITHGADGGKLLERAKQALKDAGDLRKKGDLAGARSACAWAWLVATAAENAGAGGGVAAQALETLGSVDSELVRSWAKAEGKLDARLSLVLRDRSFAEALADISKASGLTMKLIAGSLEDAAGVTGRADARVTYLDLRNATVAQALDWLTRPERMTWWMSKGAVVVGTCRRGDVPSAWVYDASILALPDAAEFQKAGNYEAQVKLAKESADEFLALARKALGLTDESSAWFAPGQLLVFADAAAHAKAAKLIADLADPKATVSGDLAKLHEKTSKRAEAAKPNIEKSLAAEERSRVLSAMREFSWRLLASAAGGEIDVEALTELQVAWRSPLAAELAKDAKSWAAMRSAWAINEAASALRAWGPWKEPPSREVVELGRLAQAVRKTAAAQTDDALAALAKTPDDPAAFLRGLYAALAVGGDVATKAAPLLAAGNTASQVAPLRPAAAALLAPAGAGKADALIASLGKAGGDDAAALTALACRRAGPDAWAAFRAASRDLLGKQPLDGSVVVLVNRLSRTSLPIAVAAK